MNDATPLTITDRHRKTDILLVLITASGKFIHMDWLQWKLPFIALAIIFWTGYAFLQSKRHPGILQHWGFRSDNFFEVTKLVFPFGLVAVIACIALGFYRDTLNVTWHILPLLVLYPVWGIIQQFLCIALVAGNLHDMEEGTPKKIVTILITATLFGILHYPFWWLMVGTFLLALFYGFIYLRARNLYVLGIFHGWLGALFFYTVVGRDPFVEVFGKCL